MKSPIRYFGGKGLMFKEIQKHFPKKDSYNTFIEPFGGSASILLNSEPVAVEIYNDLEHNVYSLFKVISDKDMFEEFKFKCQLTPYSRDVSDEYKLSLDNDELSMLDRAYKFFYVNRTCYNGIGSFSYTDIIRRNVSKSISDYLSTVDNLSDMYEKR
jgi:site-specific DNA-adenine methylase